MKRFVVALLLLLLLVPNVIGQNFPQTVPRSYYSDSVRIIPKRPWVAATEVVGVNMVVWGFNRFVTDQWFARINLNTMKDNFKTGPIWDTDQFSTNLIAHPYHGSLYYNAARSNGMNFWQSIPYTVGGSFMWEFLMEAEPPSINDLFATSFGGVALGEVTHRLSDLFIDDRTTGSERIGREILSGVISPIRALNRIISGDAWRVSPYKGRSLPSVPVSLFVQTGVRFLAEQENAKDGTTSMSVAVRLDYGDPYDDDYYSPYEWFQFKAALDFFSSQPLISQVNVIGALWGKNVWSKGDRNLMFGVFQHFDYYDSDLRIQSIDYVAPYRISQTAAVGGGMIYSKESSPQDEHKVDVFAEMYVNGIAMGASVSDYLKLEERDYNLGSGYSSKGYFGLTYDKKWSLVFNTENYHIFTWKGYDPNMDWSTIKDLSMLNVQGEKSNARLTVFSASLSYFSPKRWNVMLTNRYFSRDTRYKYYKDVSSSTYDISLTVGYRL